jgi:hypothetical protein
MVASNNRQELPMRETGLSPAHPAEAATDRPAPAWRLWLTQVYVGQLLARLREILDDRRQLRGQRGNGWRRKGLRRRLAHAAGCLFHALGLLRGIAPVWPISAATVPLTGHTIDGAFDGATSVSFADFDGDGDLDALGAAVVADDITWWESDGTPADGGWITHTTEVSSTAEDQPNDLPLAMAFTANTQSSAGGTELLLPTPTPTAIAPTSVELRYFHGAGASDRVTPRWETATETDVLGFNVYRSTEAGQQGGRVNAALIPATGGAADGGRYELRDAPRAIGTYFYRLEVVDQGGAPETYGPVTVRVDAIRAFLPWAKGGR